MRTGIFIDIQSSVASGGYGIRFDVLKRFAQHDSGTVVAANAYMESEGQIADQRRQPFLEGLRDFGYRPVVTKRAGLSYRGQPVVRQSSTAVMVADMLSSMQALDRYIVIGVNHALPYAANLLVQAGKQVVYLYFNPVMREMVEASTYSLCGYLVPNLLPTRSRNSAAWGAPYSRVRGLASYFHEEGGYGFMRFIRRLDGKFWVMDTRDPDSPYGNAYFHISQMPPESKDIVKRLPSRQIVFEFDLKPSPRNDGKRSYMMATNLGFIEIAPLSDLPEPAEDEPFEEIGAQEQEEYEEEYLETSDDAG